MTFRSRLLLAFAAATLVPLVLLALGVRRQISTRLTAQDERRVHELAQVAMEDLQRESAAIDGKLRSLTAALADDNRFRLAAVYGAPGERTYLLDWAGNAMRLTGLTMLQLQDESGRILSSGHFRNEFDRLDPRLPQSLAIAAERPTLVATRVPDGRLLTLARVDSVRVGERRFTLVGGITVDSTLLARFSRDDELSVGIVTPVDTVGVAVVDATAGAPGGLVLDSGSSRAGSGGAISTLAELPLAYVDSRSSDSSLVSSPARLVISRSRSELPTLLGDVNRWFLVALGLAIAGALALALWLSSGLSRPIAALARATSTVDLEGPEIDVATGRDDEIGALARRFGVMTRRLRASALRLRDAERRATIGDMARQVNHDIKNGLIPIRNVLRHLVQVQEEQPAELAQVFGERRATLESSIGYLDEMARSYARLTPRADRRAFDANAVVRDVASAASGGEGVAIHSRLAPTLPPVLGDPLVLRRIVDNLLRNALEALPPSGGSVTLETARVNGDAGDAVRVVVADTGRGMSEQELARAFDDFFTTKQTGTGLGLSVVRRLTNDLHGMLRVTSESGRGTTFTIDLPTASAPAHGAERRAVTAQHASTPHHEPRE
jgi:signal transduction histidine kinase